MPIQLSGTDLSDIITGTFLADEIWGFGGDDSLSGLGGNDILVGGAGADELDGGAGHDTASYVGSAVGVWVALENDGPGGFGFYGDAAGDVLYSIENLTGSAQADVFWGNQSVNVLNGMDGDDELKGFGGADTLRGGGGGDYLDGGAGADIMTGGMGSDTYILDDDDDVVIESGGQGYDVVRISIDDYQEFGDADIERLETTNPDGTEALALFGSNSGNDIIGNNGDNWIDGWGPPGTSADQMTGRGGNDTYVINHTNDQVIENGGQGIDTVYALVSWTLTAGSDVELLDASIAPAGIDLTGNASGNVVRGNAGNNTLNGGDGRDELTGLAGQDRFLFNTPLNAAGNVDTITDFNVADDTILLDNAVFSSLLGLGPISAGEFVIGAAAQDANDRIIYDNVTGALYYDSDGVGGNAQVQFADVGRNLALTNLDFVVVTGTQLAPPGRGDHRLPVDRAQDPDFLTSVTMVNGSMPVIDLAAMRPGIDPIHHDLVW